MRTAKDCKHWRSGSQDPDEMWGSCRPPKMPRWALSSCVLASFGPCPHRCDAFEPIEDKAEEVEKGVES